MAIVASFRAAEGLRAGGEDDRSNDRTILLFHAELQPLRAAGAARYRDHPRCGDYQRPQSRRRLRACGANLAPAGCSCSRHRRPQWELSNHGTVPRYLRALPDCNQRRIHRSVPLGRLRRGRDRLGGVRGPDRGDAQESRNSQSPRDRCWKTHQEFSGRGDRHGRLRAGRPSSPARGEGSRCLRQKLRNQRSV